ncbi:hypothetical protein O4H49_02085 [Kiloniella laminariae]|uniref:Uncharacterized protein n=1 Tax=Kiloniella laminariae TaxID=454162 RepID=A0ABT4LEM1_9PROT|nr:hypothetical protein [Kiloniella laminariae]MCZ4279548.1 hypothetical protein [Kiloniella laminariae]
MGRLVIRLWAAFLVVLLSAPAQALEYRIGKSSDSTIVLAEGDFEEGDSERLERLLRNSKDKPHTVWLVSDGGIAFEGMLVGETIRANRMATHVPDKVDCASACVLAFLGGVIRSKSPRARIGVHMASGMFNEDYVAKLKELLLDPEIKLDNRIQLIIMISEQNAARIMADMANYVQKMGVSLELLFPSTETDHVKIHWLSNRELKDYNVINIVN